MKPTKVVCVAECCKGSGKPFAEEDKSLFLNFCGGGIVSTRPGSCVRGKPLVLPTFLLGPCAGETLNTEKSKILI